MCDSVPTASDPAGADADDLDGNCAPVVLSTRVPISGCTGIDDDFDGPPYLKVWPGSTTDVARERRLDPRPLRFTSPLFNGDRNYTRVAFEADLPRIEGSCNVFTGAGCTNPPAGAQFYPIYTTAPSLNAGLPGGGDDQHAQTSQSEGDTNRASCAWQFGGPFIPDTTNTFGGSSVTEYGTTLLRLAYPRPSGPSLRFNNYRHVLTTNPCPAPRPED